MSQRRHAAFSLPSSLSTTRRQVRDEAGELGEAAAYLSRHGTNLLILVYARLIAYNHCLMKTSASLAMLPLPAEDALQRLGARISSARRARYLTQSDMASKAGVSLSTMAAIETGTPTVQIGFYLGVLFALDALDGLDKVAVLADDEETLSRLSESLPKRVRK